MQNGAMKNAAITLSSCSPAHPGESWTGRFRAMPDQQVSQWPDTTQAAISEIQLWPPCLSSTTSSNKDSNNFSARLAASVENSLLSPISSSDVRCSAKDLSENRKRAHAVWNDTVRSYSRSAGSANEAVYNMQRSRSSAGAEISDLRESLLTSSNEMFSLYKPTVNEGFAFPWSNSVEVLTSSGNSGGFDKQSLHIQRDVWASSSMDRLSNDGKVIRGIDTALSTAPSYCNTSPVNINADNGFRGLRVQTTENARKAELASLLNASNDKFLFEGFNVDSYSNDAFIRLPDQTTSRPISDSLGPGNGTRLVKMDEISSSNNIISSTLSQITPSSSVTFQSSNILTLHGNMNKKDLPLQNKAATVQPLNSAGTVNDSASVSSSSNHRLKSTSQTDEDEEFLTEQIKRKGSAFENGDQAASNHAFKKPRITSGASTLSAPLKVQVRKEKLGERITALQQLVSPFGKTDTASVLLEAIGYIKFLQEQVQVLSAPYLKAANPSTQVQVLQEGREETSYDLRSRGLCLVPVSSTAHVTNDNGADFWTSGIGSGCRS